MTEELFRSNSTVLGIVQFLVSFIGLGLVYMQVNKMNDQLIHDKNVVLKQKALDMSKEFADLINDELGFILSAYKNHPFMSFDKDKKISDQFYDCTVEEAKKLFEVDSLEELSLYISPGSINKHSLISAYINQYGNNGDDSLEDLIALQLIYASPLEDKNIEPKHKELFKKIELAFENKRMSLLNKLEWFSMHFNSGLADSNFVYRSLHQALFSSVSILYLNIVFLNSKAKCKDDYYYQHLIELFQKWKTISNKKNNKIKSKI